MKLSLVSHRLLHVREISRRFSSLKIVFTLLMCLCFALVLSCGKDNPSQKATQNAALKTDAKSEQGRALLASRCSTCHNTDRITKAKKTKEEWGQTVQRMVVKGAKLNKDEQTVLTEYLAAVYKP